MVAASAIGVRLVVPRKPSAAMIAISFFICDPSMILHQTWHEDPLFAPDTTFIPYIERGWLSNGIGGKPLEYP